jgi:imidazoleglycerol phosphate synthase glutamine amidotransferase subunit HisH
MIDSPDAVYLIIPCMKELGMGWNEIKDTPRYELMGLMAAYSKYELVHSYDGYSDKDISNMAKEHPEVRSQYNKYLEANQSYKERANVQKKEKKSFTGLLG